MLTERPRRNRQSKPRFDHPMFNKGTKGVKILEEAKKIKIRFDLKSNIISGAKKATRKRRYQKIFCNIYEGIDMEHQWTCIGKGATQTVYAQDQEDSKTTSVVLKIQEYTEEAERDMEKQQEVATSTGLELHQEILLKGKVIEETTGGELLVHIVEKLQPLSKILLDKVLWKKLIGDIITLTCVLREKNIIMSDLQLANLAYKEEKLIMIDYGCIFRSHTISRRDLNKTIKSLCTHAYEQAETNEIKNVIKTTENWWINIVYTEEITANNANNLKNKCIQLFQ